MARSDIPDRSKAFALRVIKLCQVLEKTSGIGRTLSKQLIRSGTSIGANVAGGSGSQSEADF